MNVNGVILGTVEGEGETVLCVYTMYNFSNVTFNTDVYNIDVYI